MLVRFTVTDTDGQTATGATTPVSVVEAERRFDLGVVDLFIGASPRMEALYWLMWRSLHPLIASGDDAAFMAWLSTLADFEVETDDLPPPPPPS